MGKDRFTFIVVSALKSKLILMQIGIQPEFKYHFSKMLRLQHFETPFGDMRMHQRDLWEREGERGEGRKRERKVEREGERLRDVLV